MTEKINLKMYRAKNNLSQGDLGAKLGDKLNKIKY